MTDWSPNRCFVFQNFRNLWARMIRAMKVEGAKDIGIVMFGVRLSLRTPTGTRREDLDSGYVNAGENHYVVSEFVNKCCISARTKQIRGAFGVFHDDHNHKKLPQIAWYFLYHLFCGYGSVICETQYHVSNEVRLHCSLIAAQSQTFNIVILVCLKKYFF